MGEIVFWTIIRIAIVIPSLWILKDYINYQIWFSISLLSIFGIIVHPTVIHYRLFMERNKEIIDSTMCSSCKNFDESAVLCLKHDEHPTTLLLPCEGFDWEPLDGELKNENEDISADY